MYTISCKASYRDAWWYVGSYVQRYLVLCWRVTYIQRYPPGLRRNSHLLQHSPLMNTSYIFQLQTKLCSLYYTVWTLHFVYCTVECTQQGL